MKITSTESRVPVLQAIINAGGSGKAATLVTAAIALLGGDAADKTHVAAVNNAAFDLKGRGCLTAPERGVWSITDVGRAVAAGAELPKGAAAPQKAPAANTPAAPAAVPAVASVPAANTPAAVAAVAAEPPAVHEKRHLAVAPVSQEGPEWLHDEGLRALVIGNTACYGAWSAADAACGECSLRGHCRNAKAATLVLLASKIKTGEPIVPLAVSSQVAALDSAVQIPAKREAPNLTGTLKATHATKCFATGHAIVKGDIVRYVQGKGLEFVQSGTA